MAYRCSICVGFMAVSLRLLLSHMRRNHASDANFHVLCGLDGCSRTYRRFVSFRNHLIRKHSFELRDEEAEEQQDNHMNGLNEDDGQPGENGCGLPEGNIINDQDPQESKQRHNALCLLAFKDKGRVPQTVVDLFVDSSASLVRNSVQVVEREVQNKLRAMGSSIEAIPGLKEIFDDESMVMNPFHGIENEKKQYRFYQQHFKLVEPRKVILGQYHRKVRRGSKLKDVETTDDAFYIPLLESLQQLLNNDSILEEVDHPHARDDSLLGDYCDTDHFKCHPLFGNDPHALQLLLYFDEVEVCNPLGTRANKHKLAALYYTLGNIKPKNRSHLNAIQLLGLVTTRNLKTYGIEPLLNAFMDDLEKLEQDDGHMFVINNKERRLRGTISYLSADNLGAQYIGGFKVGSASHRKCRECMAIHNQIQCQFDEDTLVLRTKEAYTQQCGRLQDNDHFKKTYGLNKNSILNKSRYFHVVGGLPADAMHDILEGVLQYTIKEVLKVFIIEKGFFTLDVLNGRIASFDFGYHNDTNKPASIQRKRLLSNDNSLKQHANQMWCLALHLPLLIGDHVPEDDEHFELLWTLLEITRIAFAPILSPRQIPYTKVLIQRHHEMFKELFPQNSVTPKMHYLIHMPRMMLKFGPLVGTWCMRYEAKHHYFKRLAVMLGNFINLSYSLAKRHQESLTYRLNSSEGSLTSFIEKGADIGQGRRCFVADTDYEDMLKAQREHITHQTPVYETKWVTLHGMKYKVGAIIHIGQSEDELPLFWLIEKIVVVNRSIRDIMFLVTQKTTVQFSQHLQSYEVTTPHIPERKMVSLSDFSCALPLNQCKAFGLNNTRSRYICHRYDLEFD